MEMKLVIAAAFAIVGFTTAAGPVSATTYAAPPSAQQFDQAWVTNAVNVRSGPGAGNSIVQILQAGDYVNVGECLNDWCYVDAFGGNGWVSRRYIGAGPNPINPNVPAGPGIPSQEPGTDSPQVMN